MNMDFWAVVDSMPLEQRMAFANAALEQQHPIALETHDAFPPPPPLPITAPIRRRPQPTRRNPPRAARRDDPSDDDD
jgi:hypothetical protein